MSVVQPRLYRASAGTGKTFALTTQALRLLVRGIDPESLLATTFTRKAAGEIQERILGRLVDAVGSEDVLIELNGHLESDPKLERDACVALLSGLLRRIDRLGVQTLDAFFVRLATLWGLELGLPPGWEIIEETSVAGLHEEAIARVLDDANEAELLELLRGLQREEPRRSVYGGLRKLVVDAYGIYLQSTEAAWEALPPLPLLGTEELAKRLDELRIAPIPQSASTEKPNKNWVKAHAAALQCVESGHWEDLLSTGLAKKVLADDLVYSRHAIEGAMRDALQALVLHARAVLVQTLLERSRSHRELLRRFHEALEGLKRERRLYDFDDLPRALQRGAEGTLSGESLAFRLDGGIDHLLLDEFQDTSALQGGVLGPLLERVLDEERAGSFFCVGDTKQSIYGWRQGEPRLLETLPDRYPSISAETLERNFRSSPVVLDSVRQVFEGIADSPALDGKPAMQVAARAWQASFHAPQPEKKFGGAVHLYEVETTGESVGEQRAEVVRHAVKHVAHLVAEAPRASIGVLVRRKESMPPIIYGLMELGIAASGEGGNPLTDSEAVRLALSLLTLADHPDDSAAFFHVTTSVFGEWFSTPWEPSREVRHGLSARVRRALAEEGYGRFLGGLLERVELDETFDGWDRTRFGQLVDLGFSHDQRPGLRPGDFVDRVWAERIEAPSGAPVKVMTIHGAKGLEFDAVVLPDLDGSLVGRTPALLTRRTDPWQAMELVVPYSSWNAVHPELMTLAGEAEGRNLQEELCVLYVAMTRAVRRLDMLTSRPPAKGTPRSFSRVLRSALGEAELGPGPVEGAQLLWRHPDSVDGWAKASHGLPSVAEQETEGGGPAAAHAPLRLAPSETPRWNARRSPSSQVSGRGLDVASLLRLADDDARVKGLLVHDWLSAVEWLAPSAGSAVGALSDDALRDRARALARRDGLPLNDAQLDQHLAGLREMLARPETERLLTAPGGPCTVWRERPFAVRLSSDGDPVLMRGVFDRVVLHGEPGAWTRAEIVDFKTDRVTKEARAVRKQLDLFAAGAGVAPAEGEDAVARAEHYRPQMDAYREVLQQLTGLPAGSIACRLLFLAVDEVVEL